MLDNLGEGARRRSCTALCPAAENHDGLCPHVFLLVDAQLLNAGTVKSGRHQRVDRSGSNVMLLRLCGECAKAQQRQKDAGQDYKQTDQNAQIKEPAFAKATAGGL
ncbi:MAG: hypothetical protein DME60_12095 [Verrucomicrobia bacterium]|nr:MAG: hypothetical protein DME60_12095 [Verrucomicrobiota bacterium]